MRLVTAELFLCFAHIPIEASIVSFNAKNTMYVTLYVSVKPLNTRAFFSKFATQFHSCNT